MTFTVWALIKNDMLHSTITNSRSAEQMQELYPDFEVKEIGDCTEAQQAVYWQWVRRDIQRRHHNNEEGSYK